MFLKGTLVSLRLINGDDLEEIHALHALPETDQFNTLGIPKNIDETKAIIKPWIESHELAHITTYTFALELIESKHFIGLIGLKLGSNKYKQGEVWYKLHKDYWGKGYATEALSTLIKFGFNHLNLHRIEAGCAVENGASIRVLEKVGMIKEGRKRKVLPLKSGWSDNFEFAILDEDFDDNSALI